LSTEGWYNISVRVFDGEDYSETVVLSLVIEDPEGGDGKDKPGEGSNEGNSGDGDEDGIPAIEDQWGLIILMGMVGVLIISLFLPWQNWMKFK